MVNTSGNFFSAGDAEETLLQWAHTAEESMSTLDLFNSRLDVIKTAEPETLSDKILVFYSYLVQELMEDVANFYHNLKHKLLTGDNLIETFDQDEHQISTKFFRAFRAFFTHSQQIQNCINYLPAVLAVLTKWQVYLGETDESTFLPTEKLPKHVLFGSPLLPEKKKEKEKRKKKEIIAAKKAIKEGLQLWQDMIQRLPTSTKQAKEYVAKETKKRDEAAIKYFEYVSQQSHDYTYTWIMTHAIFVLQKASIAESYAKAPSIIERLLDLWQQSIAMQSATLDTDVCKHKAFVIKEKKRLAAMKSEAYGVINHLAKNFSNGNFSSFVTKLKENAQSVSSRAATFMQSTGSGPITQNLTLSGRHDVCRDPNRQQAYTDTALI